MTTDRRSKERRTADGCSCMRGGMVRATPYCHVTTRRPNSDRRHSSGATRQVAPPQSIWLTHYPTTQPGDPGSIVTWRGICACGGAAADGTKPYKYIWEKHMLEVGQSLLTPTASCETTATGDTRELDDRLMTMQILADRIYATVRGTKLAVEGDALRLMAELRQYRLASSPTPGQTASEELERWKEGLRRIVNLCAPGPKGNHHRLDKIFGTIYGIQSELEHPEESRLANRRPPAPAQTEE